MTTISKSKSKVREEDLEALFGSQTIEWGRTQAYRTTMQESDMSMSAEIGGTAEYSGFDGEQTDGDDLDAFDSVPTHTSSRSTYAVAANRQVPGFNRIPTQRAASKRNESHQSPGTANIDWGDDDDDDFTELDDIPGVSNPDDYVSVKPMQMMQTGARYNASASVSPSVSVRRNGLIEAAGSEGFTAFANGLVTMMTAFFVSVMPVILIDTVAQPIAIMLMVHPMNLIWFPYSICMTLVGFRLSSLIFGTPIWDDLTTDRREATKRFKKETERKEHEFETA